MRRPVMRLAISAALAILLVVVHEGLLTIVASQDLLESLLVHGSFSTALAAGLLLVTRVLLFFVVPGWLLYCVARIGLAATSRLRKARG